MAEYLDLVGLIHFKEKLDDAFQGKLTAGSNVSIDSDNVISATDTTYTAGTNIAITNNQIATVGVLDNYSAQTIAAAGNKTFNGSKIIFNSYAEEAYYLNFYQGDSTQRRQDIGGLSSSSTNAIEFNFVGGPFANPKQVYFGVVESGANPAIIADTWDLGSTDKPFANAYISGYLSDGTTALAVDEIQHKLTAGTNITIDANNVISATGGSSYTAGSGITITDNVIAVDYTAVQEKMTAVTNTQIDALFA